MATSSGRAHAIGGKAFSDPLNSSLAQAPAVFWTTDLQLRITSIAGAGFEICPDHCLGRPVSFLFQRPESSSTALDAHSLAAGGESCAFDANIMGCDVHVRIKALRDARGNIVGVVGIALDDTERIFTQRALRISEQSYRSLIEDAPHAVCRSTSVGNLLQVNRAMQEMLSYSEPELLMRNLATHIFAVGEQYSSLVEKLRERKSWHGFEAQWLRRDGQTVTVNVGGRAVCDASGEIFYLDLFAENIGEHKELEAQLLQAQKMQAVGQLAGGIAHDFNNLLTVIRGQTEMMREDMLSRDSLESRLQEIEVAAERAIALTRQLLAFSRRQVLQTKVLNLNVVVGNVSQMLARLIGENVELAFTPAPDLWLVKVDPGQIEQALMNLAVNARDAMPEGGQLTITTRNVSHIELSDNRSTNEELGDFVRLSVRDTGHGMDEAIKARIFEPFFTTKQVGKGTGLGLSVVYGVIKQSGGYVRVESQPGAGAEFHLFLPRADGAEEKTPEMLRGSVPSGNETILLVEDDDSIRSLLTDFLQDNGYRVLTAKDGADAVRLMESEHDVALLLSDMMMPKMGGRELANKLRDKIPGLKVVLMSGHPGEPQPAGDGTHFVQKPFSMMLLASAVRDALNGDSNGRPDSWS